jgi:hypothetical protein
MTRLIPYALIAAALVVIIAYVLDEAANRTAGAYYDSYRGVN